MRVALLVALLLVTASVAPVAVAADEDDESILDSVLSDDESDGEDPSLAERVIRWVAENVNPGKTVQKYTDEPGDAGDYCSDAATAVNDRSAAITTYLNNRTNASTSADTLEVVCNDRNGGSSTYYVVADVTNGTYENLRMVDSATFEGLNKTADHWIVGDWYASKNAAADIRTLIQEVVINGKDVPTSEKARLASKYSGSVWSDLWGNDRSEVPT